MALPAAGLAEGGLAGFERPSPAELFERGQQVLHLPIADEFVLRRHSGYPLAEKGIKPQPGDRAVIRDLNNAWYGKCLEWLKLGLDILDNSVINAGHAASRDAVKKYLQENDKAAKEIDHNLRKKLGLADEDGQGKHGKSDGAAAAPARVEAKKPVKV